MASKMRFAKNVVMEQNGYTVENILRVAKRHNNRKRSYILVNPWQGKHVPVSPTRALAMMKALGDKVAENYGRARLVIGFAETATAIGAVVAETIHHDCVYVQTTRENMEEMGECLEFLEEHSHAPEQKLVIKGLEEAIEHTDIVVLVDDEISTGRTICNIITQLREKYPVLQEKQLVAASILNRLSPADEERLQAIGVASEWLVKLPQDDYTSMVAPLVAESARLWHAMDRVVYERRSFNTKYDPRCALKIGSYIAEWEKLANDLSRQLPLELGADTLVLGTEECMLPGLLLGHALEKEGVRVHFHATTRSPISICQSEDYPIRNGWEIRSLYDKTGERKNYIYNLHSYEQVIIVSDTSLPEQERVQSLLGVLRLNSCGKIFYIGRTGDVQHIS